MNDSESIRRNYPLGDEEAPNHSRPAAPERDRWDEQAAKLLPCSEDDNCYSDEQAAKYGGMTPDHQHSSQCPASYRPTVAAGLCKAYSEGQERAIQTAMKMKARVYFSNEYPVEAVSVSSLLQVAKLITLEDSTGELIGGRRGEGT